MSTPTSVLTTIFTGPTTCLPAAWSTFNSCGKGGVEDGTLLCAPVLRSDCFPGHTSLDDYELTTLWSPGVCPSGWYAASSSAADTAEDVTSYCCPSGMIWGTRYIPGQCSVSIVASFIEKPFSASHTFTYSYSSSSGSAIPSTTTETWTDYTQLSFATSSPATLGTLVALMYPIQVAWRESDLDSFTPKSAPAAGVTIDAATQLSSSPTSQSATETTVSSTSTTTSHPASPTASPASTGSSLSTGAKAGIGVGASIAGLAILALVGWLLFRRRRRASESPLYVDSKAELDGKNTAKQANGETPVHEMPGSDNIGPLEAPGSYKFGQPEPDEQRHELPGEFQGHERPVENRA